MHAVVYWYTTQYSILVTITFICISAVAAMARKLYSANIPTNRLYIQLHTLFVRHKADATLRTDFYERREVFAIRQKKQ